MSWFKGRNDGGETNADSVEDNVKSSSTDNLSPAARSFDDARRALRASINLESDQDTAASIKDKAQPSTITSDPVSTKVSLDPEILEKPSPSEKQTETNAVPQDTPVNVEEAKPEEDFPPLVDPKRAEDIQSILSKIGQVNIEVNSSAITDTPPPPAFDVRPKDSTNKVDQSTSASTPAATLPDQFDEIAQQAPTKPSPALPPMGTMSDPTLGKAETIPASLSNAIKDAAPQIEDSEIPDFLHESVSNVLSKPENAITDEPEINADKSDLNSDPDIESSKPTSHIETVSETISQKTETQPIPLKKEETTVDQISNHSDDHHDEKLLDEILDYEAPKPRARVVSDEPGLEIHNLGKTYKKTPVLKDVSLNVKRGEAVGLLGPNGAGKTTCFYMVCGLIPADFGSISLDGHDITELPMYRRARMGIGYLPQEASIFRGLTVAQNVRAVLEGVEKNRDKREAMLDSLLDEFSISHLRRSAAVALSGGERRRLEIARALASQPHFILLDEPLAGIDPIAVRDIRELVSHLKDRGLGVLITDHNVRETLGIVDRAYILHEGRVLMEGVPDEIIRNQEVRRVYLGDEFSR